MAKRESSSFGTRLAEERKRLGLRQAEFAERVGANVPKQSLYENDRRGLRAAYLARVHEAGVDILYLLTGKHRQGEPLGEDEGQLLSHYFSLPPELRKAMLDFVASLGVQFSTNPRADAGA